MPENRKLSPPIQSTTDRRVLVRYRDASGDPQERQIQLTEFPAFCRSVYRRRSKDTAIAETAVEDSSR